MNTFFTKTVVLITAFLIVTLSNLSVQAQVISEGFEDAGWVTSTATRATTYAGSSGSWSANCGSANTSSASSITGSKYFFLAVF